MALDSQSLGSASKSQYEMDDLKLLRYFKEGDLNGDIMRVLFSGMNRLLAQGNIEGAKIVFDAFCGGLKIGRQGEGQEFAHAIGGAILMVEDYLLHLEQSEADTFLDTLIPTPAYSVDTILNRTK